MVINQLNYLIFAILQQPLLLLTLSSEGINKLNCSSSPSRSAGCHRKVLPLMTYTQHVYNSRTTEKKLSTIKFL